MKSISSPTQMKLGGVYRIKNLVNGRIYIGSTYRFYTRFRNHINDLKVGRHLNTFLQNDYSKCGPEAFVFEVLEVVDGEQINRLTVEQKLLDVHYDNQQMCYNLTPHANETREGKKQRVRGNPLTDKRFKSPPVEILEKRAQAIREAKSSPEAKQRARENCKNGLWKDHSANVKLKNLTTQEEVLVSGSLREFALSRGLSYKALHLMVAGKTKSSGGWVKTE